MKPIALGIALLAAVAPTAAGAVMTCSLNTVTGLAFGAYNIFSGSDLDSSATISYRCDNVGGADSILVQLSRGGSSSYWPRRLSQGAYELEYNLYLDAARTTVWGDGTSGTSDYGPVVPADGVDTDLPIYGRVPKRQNAFVGSYSDTIVVTLIF